MLSQRASYACTPCRSAETEGLHEGRNTAGQRLARPNLPPFFVLVPARGGAAAAGALLVRTISFHAAAAAVIVCHRYAGRARWVGPRCTRLVLFSGFDRVKLVQQNIGVQPFLGNFRCQFVEDPRLPIGLDQIRPFRPRRPASLVAFARLGALASPRRDSV